MKTQVIADHTRRICSATPGTAGSFNDKTIIKFDTIAESLHKGSMYADVQYELFDKDGNLHWTGNPYLICDGGYHRWRSMQGPWKYSR
jgi:hypothetical protein